MSVAAIAMVVGHAALCCIAHEVDEGAAAHIFLAGGLTTGSVATSTVESSIW